jgi:hypothetical protein
MSDHGPQRLPASPPRKPDAFVRSLDDLGTASGRAATACLEAGGHDTYIEAIPAPYEARFELRQPIPVDFEEVASGAVSARFSEADLAVTGDDRRDATAGLASWILDIFDDLAAADPRTLGRTPAMQFRVLGRHLIRHDLEAGG